MYVNFFTILGNNEKVPYIREFRVKNWLYPNLRWFFVVTENSIDTFQKAVETCIVPTPEGGLLEAYIYRRYPHEITTQIWRRNGSVASS
jgi:hypothetical protein